MFDNRRGIAGEGKCVRDAFENQVEFALQAEPRGTGDAVRAALEALPRDAGAVCSRSWLRPAFC